MKRYIRLKNGIIIDTNKTKLHVDYDAGFPQLCNEDNEVFFVDSESDNIYDLAKVNDLVRVELLADGYAFDKGIITLSEICSIEGLGNFVDCCESEDFDLLELYTKQGNNYVLVWDKKRGVVDDK